MDSLMAFNLELSRTQDIQGWLVLQNFLYALSFKQPGTFYQQTDLQLLEINVRENRIK